MKIIIVCLGVLMAVGSVSGGERRDSIDLPFVNAPEVIGSWESVDFVKKPDRFVAGEKQWRGDLFLKGLTFLEGGKTPNAWQTWTKGVVIHQGDRTASHYEIRKIAGATYMFLEWKGGDYISRGVKPSYYVLKKKE